MAERETLARPYARAAFELAQEAGAMPKWSEMLQLAAGIAADPQVQSLVGDPRVTAEDLASVITGAAGDGLDAGGTNLVRLVAEAGRVTLLPEIAALYEHYRAEAEKVVDVEVRSALELDKGQEAELATALQAKLGRKVRLDTKLDPDLIGGVVIRAGDLVIDGSVKERLNKLAEALTS